MPDNYQEVGIVVIFVMIIFLVLIGITVFIILFYQKKRFLHEQKVTSMEGELLKIQLETQEHTFRQIADEIHDNVGQLLSTAKILLALTARSLDKVPETLHTATDTVGRAINELRSLSKTLNREWLEKFDIFENLRLESARLNSTGSIKIYLQLFDGLFPLTPESQVMLFRVLQEAIHNSIKHSKAKTIDITISLETGFIFAQIKDDGIGFSLNPHMSTGLGIMNMQNRVRLLGGTIQWLQSQTNGTVVNIDIPNKSVL